MKELVTQPWQKQHWNPDSHLCVHTCNHSRSHTYTHADRYTRVPAYFIWIYTASGPTEIQHAWYACVLLWIIMNFSYSACLVWMSRWYLYCLSPVHPDPVHVLAFKNAHSLAYISLSLCLPISLSPLSFLCLCPEHGMYSLSRICLISLVWQNKISCSTVSWFPPHFVYCQSQMGSVLKKWTLCCTFSLCKHQLKPLLYPTSNKLFFFCTWISFLVNQPCLW